MPKSLFVAGICRVCGCTDGDACVSPDGMPCHWADPGHTLCSNCTTGVPRGRRPGGRPAAPGLAVARCLTCRRLVKAIARHDGGPPPAFQVLAFTQTAPQGEAPKMLWLHDHNLDEPDGEDLDDFFFDEDLTYSRRGVHP